VAVEVEGGTWKRGRHNRPGGFAGDCDKYNAATVFGWRVLRCTGDMLRERPAEFMGQIAALLNERQGGWWKRLRNRTGEEAQHG